MNGVALQPYAALLGRVLYALIFIVAGTGHFVDVANLTLMAAERGVPFPQAAVLGSGGLFVCGGVLVLCGWWTRCGAAMLALTLIPVTFWMHQPLTDPGQVFQVLKNGALLGGGLLLLAHGPGPLSLDHAGKGTHDN